MQDDGLLKKINKFTKKAEFQPDVIGKVSGACKGLCLWVSGLIMPGTHQAMFGISLKIGKAENEKAVIHFLLFQIKIKLLLRFKLNFEIRKL